MSTALEEQPTAALPAVVTTPPTAASADLSGLQKAAVLLVMLGKERAAKVMESKGLSEHSEGAVLVDFSKHGKPKLGKTLVKKSVERCSALVESGGDWVCRKLLFRKNKHI